MNAESNKSSKIIIFIVIITLILSFWFVAFLLGRNFDNIFANVSQNNDNKCLAPIEEKYTSREIIDEESAVINAVSKTSDSVVSIVISKNITRYNSSPFDLFGFGSFFREHSSETELKEVGGGSGFIVSSDGLIVTNKHVVKDEDAIYSAALNNGKVYELEVLARDSANDIAVCKIKDLDEELTPLVLANSDDVKLGQTVIAIGNALALYQNTITKGIVSGIGREISAGSMYSGTFETIENVIQTDAAINSGNSGGPLINLSGEVIGINTAVSTEGQNIGFAISINSVKSVIESVIEYGHIVRPYIGVRYIQITELVATNYDLPYTYGALVTRGTKKDDYAVMSGSPAEKAGLKEGDIILEVDDIKIENDINLSKIIQDKKVGEKVKIKVYRENDGEFEIDLVLGEYSE